MLTPGAEAAEAAAQEGYELARLLRLGPKHAYGLRTLGDIIAIKGDATNAAELHSAARAKFRSLGMKLLGRRAWMTTRGGE
jgi:hypothetical protein